ncbi:hypothetical protein J6590_007142 [Homalodisca vitripennis]|nr:hypothetical protein J6590_007142 [Homalodisca vitripennis]
MLDRSEGRLFRYAGQLVNMKCVCSGDGSGGSAVCPLCHVICRATNIIENHFLVESLPAVSEGDGSDSSKLTELKCGSCPDTAATSWCVECAEFICDGCVQAHQRLKITKEHTIKPKEEGEPDNQAPAAGPHHKSLFCSVHRQEKLSLFCETCDRLTCRDCQLSDHRDHKYKFINEIAAETRNMISGLLSEVSYKRVLLKSAMKVIDDRQNLIIEKKKQLVKEITQMVVKLTNTINARGKQLVVRLNEVCDGKQKTLNEKKLALEQLSALTDHCIDFVNMALSRGSDMALLFSKTNLTTHLQRIKSRRADIPNPEIPVRINLALDKVPDLIKDFMKNRLLTHTKEIGTSATILKGAKEWVFECKKHNNSRYTLSNPKQETDDAEF